MPLPRLYKFMNVEGAKLTLRNQTFRHAKPSTFNDTEDLTIHGLFPEPLEDALKIICEGSTRAILDHLNDPPTIGPPVAEMIALIQATYRAYPGAAQAFDEQVARDGVAGIYDIDAAREHAKRWVETVNDHMQDYRVFCVTTDILSEKLWSEYTGNHGGIALSVQPSADPIKDSHLQLFRPVEYRERRPPLYANTLDFVSGSLFGDHQTRIKESIERIIYTKTLKWQEEAEYRVAVALREDEEPWDTLLFYPEEIPELYLGAKMRLADMTPIIELARGVNPAIAIFQAECIGDDKLMFHRLPARAW